MRGCADARSRQYLSYFVIFSGRCRRCYRAEASFPHFHPVSVSVLKRHGIASKVRSRYAYNASRCSKGLSKAAEDQTQMRVASASLRATAFLLISASISVSRNSIVRQRNPSRRRCRCARMRSAAEKRGAGRVSRHFSSCSFIRTASGRTRFACRSS